MLISNAGKGNTSVECLRLQGRKDEGLLYREKGLLGSLTLPIMHQQGVQDIMKAINSYGASGLPIKVKHNHFFASFRRVVENSKYDRLSHRGKPLTGKLWLSKARGSLASSPKLDPSMRTSEATPPGRNARLSMPFEALASCRRDEGVVSKKLVVRCASAACKMRHAIGDDTLP